jgi:UDP-3-O-[3-hydroxymyristoyl] glucosamine N-acyltransferase
MSWDGVVVLRPSTLRQMVAKHGGQTRSNGSHEILRFVRIERAGSGDLAPLLARRFIPAAVLAGARGASVLVDAALADDPRLSRIDGWVHPHAAWAMAEVLEESATVPALPAKLGHAVTLGEHVAFGERVVVGDRVHIGSSSVIGGRGFGWATGPNGGMKQLPHLGGVIIEDDVYIGSLCTIDAGVLGPTILRRGVKIDAQVHVGHNCDIGAGTLIAAQSGFAGSVTVGRGVRVGGQVGVADHVTVGDGARIAAKSGVIGDVPSGATVAGYPAVARARWLRGLATLYRAVGKDAPGRLVADSATFDGPNDD